jgi:hypothetical protein
LDQGDEWCDEEDEWKYEEGNAKTLQDAEIPCQRRKEQKLTQCGGNGKESEDRAYAA